MAQEKEQMIDHQILQSMLDLSFDAIIVTDQRDEITAWNASAEKLFGYDAAKVIGKNIFSILGRALISNATNSNEELITEYSSFEGIQIPVIVRATDVVDDDDTVVARAYTVRDLRQVKILEETISEKNRAMDLFIYSVSHDLRAPLRRIVNYAEILQEDHKSAINPDVQRVIERMAKNTLRMTELIDGLVSYSRLGQVTIQKTRIDMNALVNNVVDAQKKIADAQTTKFVVNELPTVAGDFNLLKLALSHLISNAIKFSYSSPEPLVEIGSSETNENVTFYIKDNGVGFDMQYAEKLFTIFQRLHNTTEFEGAGMGLAMVHQIISRQKGNVWAEGRINEGATFYFSLPK